jgi:hypothetical protein
MALGIDGQYIHLDVECSIAIVNQSSQPVSKDGFQDTYNFHAFTPSSVT